MFRHILVPLDGSSRAERAIPVAARLARTSGGTILLLQVVHSHLEFMTYPAGGPETLQAIIDADMEDARNYLGRITRLNSLAGIHVDTAVTIGRAVPSILSMVQTHQVDLVVMCSHGYTGLKRWALGSVAEKITHQASVPVLLLREGGPTLVGRYQHIVGPWRALIPLDGSTLAKEAIVPAAQLIAALSAPEQGELHLTRVVVLPDPEQISTSEREAIMHKAKRYLSNTVEHIREGLVASAVADLGLTITWSVTIDDDIASGIIRVAEEGADTGASGSSDVIVMATHGLSGLQRWAIGSVTERVLQATRLPLLIVRPTVTSEKSVEIGTSQLGSGRA